VIGLLAILLFADLLSIPSDTGEDSTVRLAIIGSPGWRGVVHGRHVLGHPFRTDAGIEWRWSIHPNYDPPYGDPDVDKLKHVRVFRDIVQYDGFYHLTRRTEQFFVYSNGMSAEEEQAILIAIERDPRYVEVLRFLPDMIRAGVRKRTFPIYWGYARNALAALVALAFVVSCTRGRPWEWFREPRLGFYFRYSLRERRLLRGQCLSCGYDLTGLESGRCPECGSDTGGSTHAGEHPV